MSWKNWIVTDKNNFIGHDRQIIKRPAHLSIVLGLGKRPKSSGEAWRVLVGAKVVLFIESAKLFDGKLFFDVDFVAFLSHMKELCFHLRALSMQYTPRMINGMESI